VKHSARNGRMHAGPGPQDAGAPAGFRVERSRIARILLSDASRTLRAGASRRASPRPIAASSPARNATGAVKERTMSQVMPQIRNVVHLMLENRSLDNLLGWLYANSPPSNFYPASNTAPYNGLMTGNYYNPANSIFGVKNYPVQQIPSQYAGQAVPAYDPSEAMVEASD
jgi:phospholipase C